MLPKTRGKKWHYTCICLHTIIHCNTHTQSYKRSIKWVWSSSHVTQCPLCHSLWVQTQHCSMGWCSRACLHAKWRDRGREIGRGREKGGRRERRERGKWRRRGERGKAGSSRDANLWTQKSVRLAGLSHADLEMFSIHVYVFTRRALLDSDLLLSSVTHMHLYSCCASCCARPAKRASLRYVGNARTTQD